MKNGQSTSSFLIIFILLALLSSCTAIYNGNMTGNAAPSNANFRHVGTVSRSNRCVYVFHIGGNAKQSQIIKLKEDLQKRYPLRNGLAWANVAVEMKTSFNILWDVRRATLSADIIDFWPDTNTTYAKYNGYYLNNTQYILVPKPINLPDTLNQDTLIHKLQLLEASVENSTIKSLTLLKEEALFVGSDVIFIKRKKPIRGIIFWTDYKYYYIGYLNENGRLDSIARPRGEIYK